MPTPLAQSQYAQSSDLATLALTQANVARFGPAACTAALQAASSLCDSYIVSQFTLPLQVSPQGWDMSLTQAVCSIAAYMLFNQYGFNPAAPADDLIVRRYNDALAWLKQIKDKEIFPQWVDSSGGSLPTSDEGGAWVQSDPPVGFTNRGLTPGGPWTPGGGWFPGQGNG